MQLAILIVLILILLVLSPWLFGVLVVLAAAYGAWVVGLLVASIVISAVCVLVYALGKGFTKPRAISSSSEAKIAEANRIYREKESARLESEHANQVLREEAVKRTKAARMITCKSCGASIEKHGMYCPACGKPPI